mmetsp:Transcript_1894/g.2678  ORF Transcript_1894/g.2678 Transcript_1894/m.2678 type:complete len:215 (-) Transcript_1894:382-1026(-)
MFRSDITWSSNEPTLSCTAFGFPLERHTGVQTLGRFVAKLRFVQCSYANHAIALFASPDMLYRGIKVLTLVLEEVNFFFPLLLFKSAPLYFTLFNYLQLVPQLQSLVLSLLFRELENCNLLFHIGHAHFRLQLLLDAKGDTAVVECLVGIDGHPDLVSHAQEQEPPLGAVQGHVADELVKALGVQVLSDRADVRLPRLALHQPLVQLLLQSNYI